VLAGRSDADRVRAMLLELDPGNVAAARAAAGAAGLGRVRVERADAGDRASYVGAVPADLVLLVGVFGNIGDADVRSTVEALPELCGPGATVIWTRGRRAPDLTPAIRRWLTDTGFVERAFHAPDDALFSVGVHRFTGRPDRSRPAARCSASAPDGTPPDPSGRRERPCRQPARRSGQVGAGERPDCGSGSQVGQHEPAQQLLVEPVPR